ncbi:putative EF-hand calcium-binding domain protein [Aspergillus clavatus NRRL 1]|uniref:EF-hand calcium-binding domain protein, putative n=1 Tax=Aspergillus clavatus (strain ATCC 1007 / CBS 513.65 / DSM 816 / NCTC 3887 / NRRL 1 / QM 1276 / 107) TaxID=344612 RepID=A1CFW3_ASPCL|nr:EF-hand calcium-binding domain protein, putative [Aspergillus clavatus NRRL 1]EAW11762.1 EF-hand calcium-binding domain protein, putative [Aspergillus clavatus NRRL 1]
MRVLCLHGKGTSGAIFHSQTSSFRSRLEDLNLDFEFINGRFPSAPAPGINLFYPPPYFSFWEDDSPDAVQATCAWLTDLIARRGPYDAVMAFSQGTALAAALLLLHRAHHPSAPPPFKAAIFICGGAPLALVEGLGFDVPASVKERDQLSRTALAAQADASAILARGSARWTGTETCEAVEEGEGITCPFRVGIPTVHVYGAKDPRYVAGLQLAELCQPAIRMVYDHGGGHEIPRLGVVSEKIAELVRWALSEGM